MEEEAVEIIRETTRNTLVFNRRRLRDEETDVRRSLANLRISTENIADIANKVRTKSVTVAELQTLKNALIDDQKYIEVVLNVHGALRGLVREISGHDVRKQCEAASCLCNLSLGDSKAGAAIAKAAGPYLIATLDNLTADLSLTCVWALGNLAGSGDKACELLVAQGAIAKLTDLLLSTNVDVQEAAVEALVQFTYQLKSVLRSEYLTKIQSALTQKDITPSTLHLLFILSCHNDFTSDTLPEQYIEKILNELRPSVETYFSNKNTDNLLYLLRLIANFNNVKIYETVLFFFHHNMDNIKQMLGSDLKESLLWLLGNMFNCYPDHKLFKQLS